MAVINTHPSRQPNSLVARSVWARGFFAKWIFAPITGIRIVRYVFVLGLGIPLLHGFSLGLYLCILGFSIILGLVIFAITQFFLGKHVDSIDQLKAHLKQCSGELQDAVRRHIAFSWRDAVESFLVCMVNMATTLSFMVFLFGGVFVYLQLHHYTHAFKMVFLAFVALFVVFVMADIWVQYCNYRDKKEKQALLQNVKDHIADQARTTLSLNDYVFEEAYHAGKHGWGGFGLMFLLVVSAYFGTQYLTLSASFMHVWDKPRMLSVVMAITVFAISMCVLVMHYQKKHYSQFTNYFCFCFQVIMGCASIVAGYYAVLLVIEPMLSAEALIKLALLDMNYMLTSIVLGVGMLVGLCYGYQSWQQGRLHFEMRRARALLAQRGLLPNTQKNVPSSVLGGGLGGADAKRGSVSKDQSAHNAEDQYESLYTAV